MNTIKSSLKSKEGMALPAVLAFFVVLCLFTSAMYIMAMTSLREVRYSSESKKAEYLAQAGVEAAAFAYQTAVNNRGGNAEYDAFVTTTSNDDASVITMDPVYMVWYQSTKSYDFITEAEVAAFVSAYGEKNVIGSYVAELTNDEMEYDQFNVKTYNSDNGQVSTTTETVQLSSEIKVIKAKGMSYNSDIIKVKSAYIPNPKQAYGTYYSDDGIIDGSNSEFVKVGEYTFPSKLTLKTHYLGSASIDIGSRTIPLNMAYCAGNMILGEPQGKNVDSLSFDQDTDNMVVFAGMNDLFVEAGIDTEPGRTHFNYMFLRGNNIVVNGNIELYAYGFTRNTRLNITANFLTLADIISGKYRFSTVVIGTPSKAGTTVHDSVKNSVYGFGDCGRIYFGGDVYINIEFPNVGTYRYKAFSAGDAYYFNDDLYRTTSESDQTPYGIDLMKYFLDKAIAEQKYSKNVLNRFEDLINTYYNTNDSAETTVYVVGDGNGNVVKDSMRKIDRDTYSEDKFSDLIPPDPTGSTSIVWENVG